MPHNQTDELVEKVARALLAIEDSWNDHEWEQLPESIQTAFKQQAAAAYAAMQSHQPVDGGEVWRFMAAIEAAPPSDYRAEGLSLSYGQVERGIRAALATKATAHGDGQ